MVIKQKPHVPIFLSLLVVIYAVSLYLSFALLRGDAETTTLTTIEAPALLADAVVADLTLLVPLLYYFLLVRAKGWPAITVVPVFLASLLVASLIIPARYDRLLDLLHWLVAPIELLVLGLVGYQAYRLIQRFRQIGSGIGGDILESLRAAAQSILGNRFAAGVLAFELAIFYYAFLSWRKPPAYDHRQSFSHHKRVGYGAVLATIIALSPVEMFAIHLLVQQWSVIAAWSLTAVSIYGLIWLLGDYQAIRQRQILLTDDGLDIRLGIRWSVRIPWQAIESIRPVDYRFKPSKRTDYLNAIVLGAPRYVVNLNERLKAFGPYGIEKAVTQVGFTVDDHDRFDAELKQRLASVARKTGQPVCDTDG